jgi:hypothetical protein
LICFGREYHKFDLVTNVSEKNTSNKVTIKHNCPCLQWGRGGGRGMPRIPWNTQDLATKINMYIDLYIQSMLQISPILVAH